MSCTVQLECQKVDLMASTDSCIEANEDTFWHKVIQKELKQKTDEHKKLKKTQLKKQFHRHRVTLYGLHPSAKFHPNWSSFWGDMCRNVIKVITVLTWSLYAFYITIFHQFWQLIINVKVGFDLCTFFEEVQLLFFPWSKPPFVSFVTMMHGAD